MTAEQILEEAERASDMVMSLCTREVMSKTEAREILECVIDGLGSSVEALDDDIAKEAKEMRA